MSAFEYLFTFYGLLLGLAAANVATGFADMWRDRREVSVGVCTPLIAVIVLLGCMNLWLSFWTPAQFTDLDPWRMISTAGVALPYVFVSRAMFPGGGGATSLEDHYLAHRRIMLIALTIPPVVALTAGALRGGGLPFDWHAVWAGLRIAAPLALLPFSGRLIHRVGLTVIVLLLIVGLFR